MTEMTRRARQMMVALMIATCCRVVLAQRSADLPAPQKSPPVAGLKAAIHLGSRPLMLVRDMDPSGLKDHLLACAQNKPHRTDFSIGHRGAPMGFAEHTQESYEAAARMGAGIVECDVTFTKDKALVCRHSQCDLHTTTNILTTPLAAKCTQPFVPASNGEPARAQCCTSDITLSEFKTLKGKSDMFNSAATSAEQTMAVEADSGAGRKLRFGTVLSHRESIELFKRLGVKMMPELKTPSVKMPFDGDYTQAQYAQQMIDEYRAAGIAPEEVYPQSFLLEDIRYWIFHEPDFARRAVFLDGRYKTGINPMNPTTFTPSMEQLFHAGVRLIAPPMWMLLTTGRDGSIAPSPYARSARAAGLDIVTWTLERSGPLFKGGGWYYKSITRAINNDGDMLTALDVLARQAGVIGVFSDWPATTTYYANCMGLP